MMTTTETTRAGAAFDQIAESYDEVFTDSLVGRAQREAVWREIDQVFLPGNTVLELNCGTGEDALHLVERGVNVVACDASERMVNVAREKLRACPSGALAKFHTLATENLSELKRPRSFQGVFSNFAGLNCVEDLKGVATQLSAMLPPGSSVFLCVYGKFCLWEFLYYGCRGEVQRAFRRLRSSQSARVGSEAVSVHYWSMRELRRAFTPWFQVRRVVGVGIAVPPSYVEWWAAKHHGLFRRLVQFDKRVGRWPALRFGGDHVLLRLERTFA